MNDKILHKELSYKITGMCFGIHNKCGRFCKEQQYADEFEKLLNIEKIAYKREFNIKNLKETSPTGNRVDFLIDNKIIVEFKAKNFITKDDYYQVQRYLKGADFELGLIFNFRNKHLKPKRVLNSDAKAD